VRNCQNCVVSNDLEEIANIKVPEIMRVPTRKITDEATSYQIISILTGAAQRGTSASTKKLGKILAGKTGTTNDSKDTWFVGFTPLITVGTYVGYDTPKDLGKTATGANVALPIFTEFMERAYKNYPSLEFKIPDSIKLVSIDLKTGQPATGSGTIMEAFRIEETQIKSTDHNNIFDKLEQNTDSTNPEIDQSQEIY
jgi:penicillin-binding protein 1A